MIHSHDDHRRRAECRSRVIAGQTLHRLSVETVSRLWLNLVITHDITGISGPNGRSVAIALPRIKRPDAKAWLGFTLGHDMAWYGCHIKAGRQAARLLEAIGAEVKSHD